MQIREAGAALEYTSSHSGGRHIEDYFIGVHARELERLRDQHAIWRPETEALWSRAGFALGQHLADLGCGPGFSALDLARIVGASGTVTGLDKASTYLDFLAGEARNRGLQNVQTAEADVTRAESLGGPYDGIFSRFFFAFLVADLDNVLVRIQRNLKSGGVLAAMEYLTLRSATCSPPIEGFDAHTQAWIDYYARHGGDTAVGTHLPRRLEQAGFQITHLTCVGGMARAGDRLWTWWGRLMQDFGDKLVGEELMKRDDLRHLRREWKQLSQQKNAFIYTPVLLQIVAKKP